MHERQAMLVASMLFFSVTFVSESFAQEVTCNGLTATHIGTEEKDKIRGTSGDDVIVGLGGNDIIYGKGGNDVICGGDGNDILLGNKGNDIIIGSTGSDKLYGGQGIDTCDSSADDKRVIDCETPYRQNVVSDSNNDLAEKISDLQNQINNLIQGIISWTDIQGIPESLADGDDDMLSNMKCDENQILVFDGDLWVCNDAIVNTQSDTTCDGILINFEGLSHGDSWNKIQKYLEPYGVSLTADGYGKDSMDTVIIYNSDIDDGKDSDLEVGIGNLAIIPDNIKKPSDSAKGGKQMYDFDSPKKIHSIEIVDIESDEAGTITALDDNGEIIGKVELPVTGNKAHSTVKMNYAQVSSLVVDYNSSGGVTNLCYSDNEDIPNNVDTLASLDCNIDEIVKWDGVEWVCSGSFIESTPMSFHYSPIGTGGTVWTGLVSTVFDKVESEKLEVIISTSGEISNLISKTTAPMALSPPENESYTITLVKNGEDTSLTCMITAGNEMCNNTESKITVDFGDTIILKTEASQSAPFAFIRTSVLFSSN